jgi:hypothetical protein
VVATDGHVLLVLEPSHKRLAKDGKMNKGALHPSCFSDRLPLKFGIPRDSVEAWKRMLTKKDYELVIDCDEQGIITAKVIDGVVLVSEMKAAAAIESATFPPYEGVVPDWRPLDQQVACYAQPWIDAKLLKRFDLVQKATGAHGFRMQIDPGTIRERGQVLDPGPIRIDIAGDPMGESWATGVVMSMRFDIDVRSPMYKDIKPKPLHVLTDEEHTAMVEWAKHDESNGVDSDGLLLNGAIEVAYRLRREQPEPPPPPSGERRCDQGDGE